MSNKFMHNSTSRVDRNIKMLYRKKQSNVPHNRIQFFLATLLNNHGWSVYIEPSLKVDHSMEKYWLREQVTVKPKHLNMIYSPDLYIMKEKKEQITGVIEIGGLSNLDIPKYASLYYTFFIHIPYGSDLFILLNMLSNQKERGEICERTALNLLEIHSQKSFRVSFNEIHWREQINSIDSKLAKAKSSATIRKWRKRKKEYEQCLKNLEWLDSLR